MPAGLKTQWQQYTDVEDIAIKLDRFFSQISEPDPETGCCHQVWGSKHNQGYLMIHALYSADRGLEHPGRKKMVTGHRILARLKFKRPITPKDKVYHTCGNMWCLNPAHIEIGDTVDVGYQKYKNFNNTYMIRLIGRQLLPSEILEFRNNTLKECYAKWPQIKKGQMWLIRHHARANYKWGDRYDDEGNKL